MNTPGTEPVTRYETGTKIPSTVYRDGDIMSPERVHKVLNLLVIQVGVAIKQILSATNRNIDDDTIERVRRGWGCLLHLEHSWSSNHLLQIRKMGIIPKRMFAGHL